MAEIAGNCSKRGNFAFIHLKTKLVFYSLNCSNWLHYFDFAFLRWRGGGRAATITWRQCALHLIIYIGSHPLKELRSMEPSTSVPDETMALKGACWFARLRFSFLLVELVRLPCCAFRNVKRNCAITAHYLLLNTAISMFVCLQWLMGEVETIQGVEGQGQVTGGCCM